MRWFTVLFTLTLAYRALSGQEPSTLKPPRRIALQSQYEDLPSHKQGQFPIAMPDYNGIEQIILLSNQWIVVCDTNIDKVVNKINEKTDGEYLHTLQIWKQSERANKPHWPAKKRVDELFRYHLPMARILAGELRYDTAESYRVYSKEDNNYLKAVKPSQVTRQIVSLGSPVVEGGPNLHYGHYCYLQLPIPMTSGNHYTVRLADGKSATFLYDEMRSVSRAIKVNQVGYHPNAKEKFAYLGAYLHELGPLNLDHIKEFSVVNAKTGETVLKRPVTLRASDPRFTWKPGVKPKRGETRPSMTGEYIYDLDLADLKEEGEFFITIPGVGRSWTFSHTAKAYGDAFYTHCRALYHQRCGTAIRAPFTRWPRILCHTRPVYECDHIDFIAPAVAPKHYQIFDVIGKTLNRTKPHHNVTGGWHDAADWDRNIHHYTCIFDLLYAYEIAPHKFRDGQLNIPESGNGIPDILDEAEWGLRAFRNTMNEEGGVSGTIETFSHPPIDDVNSPYAMSRPTRWSSLIFAAAAAQYAYLVSPFNQERAREYRNLARRAYKYGMDPKNSVGTAMLAAARDRGKGEDYAFYFEEQDKFSAPYIIHAKVRLFMVTQNRAYLNGLSRLNPTAPKPFDWPFRPNIGFSHWLYFLLASKHMQNVIPPSMSTMWQRIYFENGRELETYSEMQPYRFSWAPYRDYWMAYGTTCMANHARSLYLAYVLSGEEHFHQAVFSNIDTMYGTNPLGMCWTTGLGYVYPVDIQHAVSQDDGIPDPVPGITVYGINGGIFNELKNPAWSVRDDIGKEYDFVGLAARNPPVWRRWSAHPNLNPGQAEFTIHETISASIFMAAMLMPDDWMPSEELKNQRPRKKELLFGYWYLP